MIPYQRQTDPTNARLCGAACLSMVYQSFDKAFPQSEIWPVIVKKNRFGSLAGNTHLMAKDALDRGFEAFAIQTSSPIQALQSALQSGIPVILNHLMEPNKPAGHYSVLVDVDEQYVFLHDPFFGPNRRLLHEQLLELWKPQVHESEITGYVLIGVSLPGTEPAKRTSCPACKALVVIPPAGFMSIFNICPACDHVWPFEDEPDVPAQKYDLSKVFGAMDKFTSFMLSMPEVAQNPDVRVQLEALVRQKGNIQNAVTAFEESQKLHDRQLAAMEKSANQAKEAHDKKIADLKAPMKQLDGRALGAALLKALGFGPNDTIR